MEQVPEIDLVLGGHDHIFHFEVNNSCIFIKSGTDFRELTVSQLEVTTFLNNSIEQDFSIVDTGDCIYQAKVMKKNKRLFIEIEHVLFTSDFPKDPKIEEIVNYFEKDTVEKGKVAILNVETPIEGYFSVIRRSSTPLTNFMADLVRIFLNVDLVVGNSGTFRLDSVIEKGALTIGALMKLFPIIYPTVRLRIKGAQIIEGLENGVSKFPSLEGRFPIVIQLSSSAISALPLEKIANPGLELKRIQLLWGMRQLMRRSFILWGQEIFSMKVMMGI